MDLRAASVAETGYDLTTLKAPKGQFIAPAGSGSPLSLLDTEAGVDLVMDTLARIEYGIAA